MLPPLPSNKRNLKNGNRDKNTLEAWEVHCLCGDYCYQHCSTVQITIMHIIKMNKKYSSLNYKNASITPF